MIALHDTRSSQSLEKNFGRVLEIEDCRRRSKNIFPDLGRFEVKQLSSGCKLYTFSPAKVQPPMGSVKRLNVLPGMISCVRLTLIAASPARREKLIADRVEGRELRGGRGAGH